MTWFRTTIKKTLQQGALTLLDTCELHIHYKFNSQHIIDSINFIDQLGQEMQPHVGKKQQLRNYTVPCPNALWHINGTNL
jgi:hypothetical protein